MVTIRKARPDDDAALTAIDLATWTPRVSPAPRPDPMPPFFAEGLSVDDVLVAEVEGAVAGYAKVRPATPLAASRHVLYVAGFAVAPAFHRRGVGRALVEAVVEEARARGMRRITLRVLGQNGAAFALYSACGFVVEGRLAGEFHLDGREVDDVLMAYAIA